MHEVLVNRLGGLSLPRKSVVRLTDRPDMTLDVYCGRKTTIQQQQQQHTTLILSCHANYMIMCVITFWGVHKSSLTVPMSAMHFLFETLFIWKAIKSHFKGAHDKLNLTLLVISYKIYETRQRLVS